MFPGETRGKHTYNIPAELIHVFGDCSHVHGHGCIINRFNSEPYYIDR